MARGRGRQPGYFRSLVIGGLERWIEITPEMDECPPAGGLRAENRYESVSVVGRWESAPDAIQMAAVCRPPSAEFRDLPDGPDARGRRALPARGGDRSERPCGSAVETLRRRHRARSAPAQGRGSPPRLALERGISVRSAAAIHDGDLQRHLQRRREPGRDPHCPVSAAARRRARDPPIDRARKPATAG